MNSVLKLKPSDFPDVLEIGRTFQVTKADYRIFPIDVPIQLVNSDWQAVADVVIMQLTWQTQQTKITYRLHRVYEQPFSVK